MKFILIMVYVLSQKTAVIQVEFDSKYACEQAGTLLRKQIGNAEATYPDGFVCVAKG
jgi:hypothetical protein